MGVCLASGQSKDVRKVQRHRARVMRRLEATLAANPEQPFLLSTARYLVNHLQQRCVVRL